VSCVAAVLSMFMNNVGALALLMPVAIQSAIKADRSPATVLMPLSFASILGGLVTLIGTPPNILIASYRQEVTGESFTMFDFTPVGGVIALAGILFMLLFGWRLVKVRSTDLGANLFDIDGYLFETRVTEDSPVVGMSTSKFQNMLRDNKMDLLARISGDIEFAPPDGRYKIKQGDYLMIQGTHDDVQSMAASISSPCTPPLTRRPSSVIPSIPRLWKSLSLQIRHLSAERLPIPGSTCAIR
jgi:hypothetical protein